MSNEVPLEIALGVDAALDKKAEDVVVIDLRGLSDVADYFLICHGTSERQVKSIADSIEERLARDLGLHPKHVEGRQAGEWILMDYVDLIVHVFREEKRRFYRLERLWGDAPVVDLPGAASKTAG